MPLDNNTLALFTGHQETFSATEAATGGGSRWPAEGVHDAYIDGISVNAEAEFRMGGGMSIPALEITFEYQLVDDPDNPENPLKWTGEPFALPHNVADIPAEKSGHKMRYEIGLQRLKSHLSVLLGSDLQNNLPVDIQNAVAKAEGDQSICAKVFCQYKQGKGANSDRTYKTDYLREVISS